MKTTKANLNRVITWSSSRYNEYKKDDVLKDIIFRVEKGEDCYIEYQSGSYSEAAHIGHIASKWSGGQYALEIKEGHALLKNYVSDTQTNDRQEIVLEKPIQNKYYIPAKTVLYEIDKWGIPIDEYEVIGQDIGSFHINFEGTVRYISKEYCRVLTYEKEEVIVKKVDADIFVPDDEQMGLLKALYSGHMTMNKRPDDLALKYDVGYKLHSYSLELDELHVPWDVQNSVIEAAKNKENWDMNEKDVIDKVLSLPYRQQTYIDIFSTEASIPGIPGTWHAIGAKRVNGISYYLMEDDVYGSEVANVITNSSGSIVLDYVKNGFADLRYVLKKWKDKLNASERRDEKMPKEQNMASEPTTEVTDIRQEMMERFKNGISEVMESENFKNWLQTGGKLFINNYSFKNSLLVYLQRPNASYLMGYEAWKRVGRQVMKGAKGIKIWMPVMAGENIKGGLFGIVNKNLRYQFNKNPELEQAFYKLGESNLEFTMLKNGIIGLKISGKEVKLFTSEQEVKKYIDRNIIGKIPMYFNLVTVFDKADVFIPQYLWVKDRAADYKKDELALDENGNIQRNGRNEVKIINTSERQAKFVDNLDLSIVSKDVVKMERLFAALQAISMVNGVSIELVSKEKDDVIKDGAKGYYHRPDGDYKNGYIKIDASLEPTERVAVAFHEMAHSELHRDLEEISDQMGEPVSQSMREIQAEATAYMVMHNFGIDTDTSSFNYLAAYCKGRELQELQKSLNLIFDESKNMMRKIEKELDKMGLTLSLDEKPLAHLSEDRLAEYRSYYIDIAFNMGKKNFETKKEIASLMKDSKSEDERNVLIAMGENINLQDENTVLICDLVERLKGNITPEEQNDLLDKLNAAVSRINDKTTDFNNLTKQFMTVKERTDNNLKVQFDKNPLETLENMKKDFSELKNLSQEDMKYITTSKFISKNLGKLLKDNPQEFVNQLMKRLEAIEKVKSKNGCFVEIVSCEKWGDNLIFADGSLAHPKAANSMIKQAEVQTAGFKLYATQIGEYYPNTVCNITVYAPTEAGKGLSALNTRIDIGDGSQKDMLDHMIQVCKRGAVRREIVDCVRNAVEERNTKGKIEAFRNTRLNRDQKTSKNMAQSFSSWKNEINSAKEESAATASTNKERQPLNELSSQEHSN